MKYSDQFADWLVDDGYTHCFYVAGGNIMHILNSVRTRMTCVPFVHEVGAGIAAEYFNESRDSAEGRAFALVTAGPGLTNIVTAMAGAYLESRDLLVVGGQVKSSDLASGGMRQRGIQEIDGIALAQPVTVSTLQIREPMSRGQVMGVVRRGRAGRKGPVFIDFCLDAQGAEAISEAVRTPGADTSLSMFPQIDPATVANVAALLAAAERPLILLGGGISRETAAVLIPAVAALGVPIATTWNAADRIDSAHPLYFGRPNTWGMRWSNVLIQQADLVLALGTRLGMQQTGFNWQRFAPLAHVVQVDIDETVQQLSVALSGDDIVVPCSSGGAFTVMMQAFAQQGGQRIVTDKGLASMGYGLSGAIGASLAHLASRTILIEGDGGFAQNLQELGTVAAQQLNLKIFLFSNAGYASIRMTQRNYFDGAYMGCDTSTGLGLPNWPRLFSAYGIPVKELDSANPIDGDTRQRLLARGPAAFIVSIDPEQTFYPKINSRVTESGTMESSPLHLMFPPLDEDVAKVVLPYLRESAS